MFLGKKNMGKEMTERKLSRVRVSVITDSPWTLLLQRSINLIGIVCRAIYA